ncbi:DUF4012 domain-containing protein, partial [bacterium]|nr:DUF4012 domain-containing protein [bacterium]
MHKNKKIDFIKAYHNLEESLGNISFGKKRRKREKLVIFLRLFTYLIFIFLVVLMVIGFYALLNIRSVYSEAMEGKDYINQSLGLIKERKFSQADVYARKAGGNFKNIEENLSNWQNNFFIERSPFLNDQISELNTLSESAFILSKSLAKITNVGVDLEKILGKDEDLKFSQFSEEEKEEVLKLIYESRPQFTGLRANINLAYLKLDKIKFSPFLFSLQERVDQIKDKLKNMEELSDQMINLFYLTPRLAGYPEQSNFLVLFQNSNELRPTGGFLGTYGILKVKNGEIIKFDTHDIYHMDMPVEGVLEIEPPLEIKKYLNDKWYMRDANWSPDWPTSARKIEWFYHEEDKLLPLKNKVNDFEGEFDGVIGVTPELVTDLLSLVGPV